MIIGVTGARGIVGRRLIERLAAEGRAVSLFPGDIRDSRSVSDWVGSTTPAALVHLAAIVEVARAEADPMETYRTNVIGALNLMRALERAGGPCWVFYTSSAHVYAESATAIPETHALRPRSVYAQSKLLGEQVADAFAQRGEIELCIGRVFSVYDPEQTGSYLYPSVAARLSKHVGPEPLAIRDGDAVRDFSSAAEVAARIAALLRLRAQGVVNIGTGRGRTIVAQIRAWFGDAIDLAAAPTGPATSVVADISRLGRLLDGRGSLGDRDSDFQPSRIGATGG